MTSSLSLIYMIHRNLPLSSPEAPPSTAPLNSDSAVHPPPASRGSGSRQAPARPGILWGSCLGSRARESVLCRFLLFSQRLNPAPLRPHPTPARPTWTGVGVCGTKEKRRAFNRTQAGSRGLRGQGCQDFVCNTQPAPPPHPNCVLLEGRLGGGGGAGRKNQNNRGPSLPVLLHCLHFWSKLSLQT